MKEIATGLIIIFVAALIFDFIYTEKNTCLISEAGYKDEYVKCGFIKKEFDLNLNFFGRYW